MKLTLKLSLAFSAVTLLVVLLAIFSWRTIADFSREKDFITLSEDINTEIANIKGNVLFAISTKNFYALGNVDEQAQKTVSDIEKLRPLATLESTRSLINKLNEDTPDLIPIIREMTKLFEISKTMDNEVTPIGIEVREGLAKALAEAEKQYEDTGDAFAYIHLSELDIEFQNMRSSIANYLFTLLPESLAQAEKDIKLLKDDLQEHATEGMFEKIAPSILQYIAKIEPLLAAQVKLNNLITTGNDIVEGISTDCMELSKLARENFETTKQNATRMLWIVAAFAIIIAIALNVYISKSVGKQLGADPGDLSLLADRVANGDYDIDMSKEYIGVYNHIISMVVKMKEALEFTRNILSSLPVPCAVFGPDNKLKFANKEMMNLLENSKKMEECIGETSGQFMYRQENFNTATLKTINSKQSSKLNFEYHTYKNNKLHVDATAQPLMDNEGNITNIITVWQDVTEQTEQAQKISDANKNMQNIAQELEQVANIAASASEQLSSQIELSEQGAQDQAERVTTTATALEEMNATVLEIARNAGTTSDSAASVRSEASAGSESMQECVKAMQEVREESLKLQTEMGVLSDHAQAINEIMNVISDIADQTNLLALNAAIEAARAGDAGRGFAVVADEVRNLAEKTMASTTDVGNAISSIQKSTSDNTRLVMGAVEKIEKVTDMVSHAGEALLGIVHLADTTADQVRAIATASEEQSATSEEISQSVDNISHIAKENANNMQEARQAVEEVVNQTNVLAKLIEQLQNSK